MLYLVVVCAGGGVVRVLQRAGKRVLLILGFTPDLPNPNPLLTLVAPVCTGGSCAPGGFAGQPGMGMNSQRMGNFTPQQQQMMMLQQQQLMQQQMMMQQQGYSGCAIYI